MNMKDNQPKDGLEAIDWDKSKQFPSTKPQATPFIEALIKDKILYLNWHIKQVVQYEKEIKALASQFNLNINLDNTKDNKSPNTTEAKKLCPSCGFCLNCEG